MRPGCRGWGWRCIFAERGSAICGRLYPGSDQQPSRCACYRYTSLREPQRLQEHRWPQLSPSKPSSTGSSTRWWGHSSRRLYQSRRDRDHTPRLLGTDNLKVDITLFTTLLQCGQKYVILRQNSGFNVIQHLAIIRSHRKIMCNVM